MLKTILRAGYATYASRGNRLIYIISRIPILGRLVKAGAYSPGKAQRAACVIAEIFHMLWQIVQTALYVAFFMLMPRYFFARYSAVGVNGFAIENCFVYFTVILSCFCGSINNSGIFKVNKEGFVMLRELKCSPRDYFRMLILRKAVYELISFWLVFSVFGMDVFRAFYLTLTVVLSRFIGDAINILVFRSTRSTFASIKGASIAVMLVSILTAYFVPYIRGYVPNAYNLIFNTSWMLIILIVSSFFIYYIWNYNGYAKIASVLFTKKILDSREEIGEINPADDDYFEKNGAEIREKVLEDANMGAYRYSNRIFFKRDRKFISRCVAVRALIVLLVFAAALIMVNKGMEESVYKAVSYSMPVLVFAMYALSSSGQICRRMYYRCDVDLLKNGYYRRKDDITANFLIRLRYLIAIDSVPALMLSAAYAAIGALIGKEGSFVTVASVCAGIILLSCFFAVFNLSVYYMAQPYR
ncbi:MAG: hypothetical protein NC223_11090, partial [Butyrivibrio sp.]|nr:hypothetical protein [Butyrivibrio sp.]